MMPKGINKINFLSIEAPQIFVILLLANSLKSIFWVQIDKTSKTKNFNFKMNHFYKNKVCLLCLESSENLV